jgi:hypothetical protein
MPGNQKLKNIFINFQTDNNAGASGNNGNSGKLKVTAKTWIFIL